MRLAGSSSRAAVGPLGDTLRLGRHEVALGLVVLAAVIGCRGGVSHESITRSTDADSLAATVTDGARGADLRGHAAARLVAIDRGQEMMAALEPLPAAERTAVVAEAAPRLIENARIDGGEMTVPSPGQTNAKDALYEVRGFANDATRQAIDAALVEWLAGGYYSGRARQGRFPGPVVIRAVGTSAAEAMLTRARKIVAAPPDASGARPQIEAELLLGLAATGSPEAAGFILELVDSERGDRSLPERAMAALYQAYVDNQQLFPVADGTVGLAPHAQTLATLAGDATRATAVVNDAIGLLATTGAEACLEPLASLIRQPRADRRLMWAAVNAAVRCAEARALAPVARAMPETGDYDHRKLEGALWEPVVTFGDRAAVAAAARELVEADGWLARLTGIEVLRRVGTAADAERVRALAGDKTVLRGWWGDQSEVPKSERQPLPTLGQRAAEAATYLDGLAKGARE